jgi:hypothetical protein
MNRQSPVLSAQGIKKWIMNFEEKFSALKKQPGKERMIRTQEDS